MQSSIVGLSILWGLASFGVQGDFIESRDTASPSWQAESRVEMEGFLMESLGADRWVFDNGSESLEISLPKGQWVSTGERLRLRFVVRRRADIAHPGLIFDVLDGRGLQLTGRRVVLPAGAEDVTVDVGFDASFQQGIYRLRMRVVDSPSIEQTVVLSRQEGWLSFEVVDDSRELFTGLFPVPMEIGITP